MSEDTAGEDDDRTVPEGYTRVPIADWATVERHLRRLPGSVETTAQEIRIRSGNAQFAVTRGGRVDTGMPLHAFERDGVDALYVDADQGRIQVRGPTGLAYEFRVP